MGASQLHAPHSASQAEASAPQAVASTVPSTRPSHDDTIADIEAAPHLASDKEIEHRAASDGDGAHGISGFSHGVDIERAEIEFAELNKQLSKTSQYSRRISRQNSHKSVPVDVEKVGSTDGSDDGEPFDLVATLRGSKQEEEEAGIKPKRIGIIWDNLTVRGIGGTTNFVKTFPDSFLSFVNVFESFKTIFNRGGKGRQVEILKSFRGVAKPGEMVLVLGRPGSGCTSFLKVIANQRFGYSGIDGDVLYGPFDSKTFAKNYRGEAVYNDEDDNHHPTLTVGQTLDFALETKVPGKRPAGLSRTAFKEKVINLLLNMFMIQHTRNTVVGNQFVRGVSGGERKRVSIAEMMCTSACVCSWDNSTRGLDASTALDFIKSLRVFTDIYETTTFVSLYQASESIYRIFDKVLVIDGGRQVFFGPASEARSYFEELGFLEKPRQTTPDYLTGCTDPFEREYKPERGPGNAPSTSDELAEAFSESRYASDLAEEMRAYHHRMDEEKHVYDEFQIAVKDSKRHASKSSVYSIPFYLQVWALMKRQFILKWQDKFDLVVSWVTSITIAIVLGTVWLDLPKTSAGAFTRGGLLFISLLFNAFQAFSELGTTLVGRPIVNKHRAYAFHRPSALWIGQIAVDLVFAAVQIFVFSVIVYFMCGLVRDAGAFFSFVLFIVFGYLVMTLFFRTLGCLCPDFDVAIRLAATIITLFVLTTTYLIPWRSEQVWLRWFFYLNPLGLGFSAMMINEFSRIDMTCTDESLIPPYGDIDHQVCTLSGSRAGTLAVSGTDYIETQFDFYPSDMWRNWGIMVVLVIGFLLANVFLGEYVTWGAGGRTTTFFVKPDNDRRALNEKLQIKKDMRNRSKGDETIGSDIKITSRATLTWEDLCYDVPISGGQLRLLRNIYGYVQPGKLTCLMGASGAGKTTLLDVLASRKNIGVVSGDILVDGKPPGIAFQRGTSYAEQLDVHEPTQSVREALRFSADLRQPYDVPQEEKYAYVEEIISLLEMEDIADAIIGNPETGLAVEQRKRVTIGVELAAKPELLLFLDEPTSGLDSQSAWNIIRFLRKLSGAGQAILCTIHQPNSALFESFDRLLLLERGGRCVYFGDIGPGCLTLLDYLRRHGAECPPDANPAEFMLEAIGAGQVARIGKRDWADVWDDSVEFSQIKEDIIRVKRQRLEESGLNSIEEQAVAQREYATPLWHQIKVVVGRANRALWRSPNYGFTRFFNHIMIALLTGLSFLRLDNSRSSLQYRVFIVFQITVLPALILAQIEPKYAMNRLISYREQAAKAYRSFPFALGQVFAEMPYSLFCAVTFFLPLYYIPGFQSASSRAGLQFLLVVITEIFSVTLGQAIAAMTPSPMISSLFNPFVIIIFALFCGVTIPKPQIPGFWRAWLYELVPFTRLIGSAVTTELHGRPVVCTAEEYNDFTAPPGQSCGSYMQDFFASGGPGYMLRNDTQDCSYCAYKVGDEFFKPLGYAFENRWRDLGIFAAFIGSNLIILFLASRFLNFNRR
ncbi:putative ABC transporter [Lineolata rhizophorae]|uniref:Putative ABC transporter n=1 Tax=Lineolata rhizophorae TaxID=578093 RepID=A0A6A6NVM5_9PEZI|nr:putative ABC transporter [Lineolata rhizophorae]